MTKTERFRKIVDLTKKLAKLEIAKHNSPTAFGHYFMWISIKIDGTEYAPVCVGSGTSPDVDAVIRSMLTIPGITDAYVNFD